MKESSSRFKPVGIWIRVSTEDQARGDSPEHHEKRARMYAESREWKVVEVYHLEGVSGKSVRDHPEARRMLEDVKQGTIEALIFSKLARLARNTRELLDFSDHFEEHSADLVSLQEAIDTSTPAGRLFYTVIAAMAQWEREEIGDRIRASIQVRAQMGKSLGGAAPFGYRWEGPELVVDPVEAPVRKLMYELYLELRRKKAVARALNERGHRTRRGAAFTDTTVDRLLRDPTAKGWRVANHTRSRNGKAWEKKPEEEWVWTPVEPVVGEETWERVNAMLAAQRAKTAKIGRRPTSLFGGQIVCECGRKMYARRRSPKYVCRGCRNKIGIEDLDAIFEEQLKHFVFSPTEVAQYLEEADKTIQEKTSLLGALEREKAALGRDMEKIHRAYVSDELSVRAFGRAYRPLEEREAQLEEEVPRLQGEIDFLRIEYLSSDEILAEARDLSSRWKDLTFEERRQIVENVVDRITVGKGSIEIALTYLPTPPSSDTVRRRQRRSRGSSRRASGSRWESVAARERGR